MADLNIISLERILSLKPHYNISISELNEFKEFYSRVEGEDKRKPMFSKTNKYKKFSKKIAPINISHSSSNAWQPLIVSKEVDKLKQIVRQFCNKITQENFTSIKDKLIEEVKEVPYVDIIPLLIDGIIKKTYMDKDFIDLYVDLCIQLFNLTEWHRKMVCIKRTKKGLLWIPKYLETMEENKYDGPYKTEKEVYEVAFKKINFRYFLLQRLKKEFFKRQEYYDLMEENSNYEEIYNAYKQKVYSIMDIIYHLYEKKHISDSIITTCLAELSGHKKEEKNEKDLIGFIYFFNKVKGLINPKMYNFFLTSFKDINRDNFSFRTSFLMEEFCEENNLIVIKEVKKEDKIQKFEPSKKQVEKPKTKENPKTTKKVEKIERFVKKKEITQDEAYSYIQNTIDNNKNSNEIVKKLKNYRYKYKRELIAEIILMKVFNEYNYDYNVIYSKLWYERVIERRDVETGFDLIIDNYEELLEGNPEGENNLIKFCQNILKKRSGISLLKIIINVLFNNRNREPFRNTFMKLWESIKDNYEDFEKQIKRLYKPKKNYNKRK